MPFVTDALVARRAWWSAILAALGLVVGCQAPNYSVPPVASPATSPETSPNPNLWTRIEPAAIEQPPGFMDVHQDYNGNLQGQCAPCHPAVDTTMTGVVDGPRGLVAVGWIFQGFHGVTWHSDNGGNWVLGRPLGENSVLHAVAADDDRYVAVGLNGNGATAWASSDGVTWDQTSSGGAFAAVPLRLTSVIHWSGGFAAAGFEGTEFGTADAAFWSSDDGLRWRRVRTASGFRDARVWAIAEGGPGLVAVGAAGDANAGGPVAVWTSPDGRRWARNPDDPIFHGVRARTIASVPAIGLIAAGEDLAGDTGVVLRSTDGIHWARAPQAPALGRPGIQIRMYAAIAGGPGVVVVGTATEGVQYGEAVVWTSPDGIAWSRDPAGAEFADGELTAVAASGSRLIAVGDRGSPDTYVATVWTSPPAWSHN
jgi:hypothetical protein